MPRKSGRLTGVAASLVLYVIYYYYYYYNFILVLPNISNSCYRLEAAITY